jgi:hypothetical protein
MNKLGAVAFVFGEVPVVVMFLVAIALSSADISTKLAVAAVVWIFAAIVGTVLLFPEETGKAVDNALAVPSK